MTKTKVSRRGQARGFTLIELGIVIAASAILTAALLPDFIASAQNKMAEKSANDIANILSAADWYYADQAATGGTGYWPGQSQTGGSCTLASTSGQSQLVSGGYVPQTGAFSNPWGALYDIDLVAGTGSSACSLRVTTSVPTGLGAAMSGFLFQASCTGCPAAPAGDPAAGFSSSAYQRCCTIVPPPGAEASLAYLENTWIPQNPYTTIPTPPAAAMSGFGSCQASSKYPGLGKQASCSMNNYSVSTYSLQNGQSPAADSQLQAPSVTANCTCYFVNSCSAGSAVAVDACTY
jgi:prepilin-type N-terminal cleavage/methylation domain-containing protein